MASGSGDVLRDAILIFSGKHIRVRMRAYPNRSMPVKVADYHVELDKVTSLFASLSIPTYTEVLARGFRRRITLLTIIAPIGSTASHFVDTLASQRNSNRLGSIAFLVAAILLAILSDVRLEHQAVVIHINFFGSTAEKSRNELV